jgi:murein DD-endopeptidase MepM/ murein hydrolase activator NlpD
MTARLTLRALLVAMLVTLCGAPTPAWSTPHQRWRWPLDPVPRVVRYFEPPDSPYGPGHRGVDLAGAVGQPVFAIGAGVVTFAGSVAGRGVLVVDHGGLRSTYQPVVAVVEVGTQVLAGRQVGLLEAVHSHCLPDVCLHLGVLRGGRYVDPLALLGYQPVVLKPLDGARPPPPGRPPLPPPEGRGDVGVDFAPGVHLGGWCDLVGEC